MFTIGHRGVLRLGGWSPHHRTGFHVPRPTHGPPSAVPVRGCHPLWPDVPVRSGWFSKAAGLVRVRSPLLTESRLMSFPPANEMFQFAGFASPPYGFRRRYRRSGGLPHSEIRGSKVARTSPRLIAACYVLHRLSVPRHPPNALEALASTLAEPPPEDSCPRAECAAKFPRNPTQAPGAIT